MGVDGGQTHLGGLVVDSIDSSQSGIGGIPGRFSGFFWECDSEDLHDFTSIVFTEACLISCDIM